MPVKRTMTLAMTISGAMCGLGGALLVFGSISHRMVTDGSLTGFTGSDGFNGIVVALFGALNPLWTILSAFLFGGMLVGGDALQVATGVPADMVTALEGLVVVFVVSLEYMRRRSRATCGRRLRARPLRSRSKRRPASLSLLTNGATHEPLLHLRILTATVAAGLGLAAPFLLAALGETMGQRSGVINLGVDGIMLLSAFATYFTALKTDNLFFAILVGMGVGP